MKCRCCCPTWPLMMFSYLVRLPRFSYLVRFLVVRFVSVHNQSINQSINNQPNPSGAIAGALVYPTLLCAPLRSASSCFLLIILILLCRPAYGVTRRASFSIMPPSLVQIRRLRGGLTPLETR